MTFQPLLADGQAGPRPLLRLHLLLPHGRPRPPLDHHLYLVVRCSSHPIKLSHISALKTSLAALLPCSNNVITEASFACWASWLCPTQQNAPHPSMLSTVTKLKGLESTFYLPDLDQRQSFLNKMLTDRSRSRIFYLGTSKIFKSIQYRKQLIKTFKIIKSLSKIKRNMR